jgi:glycerophosphoryl diester phosphodiesterase
VRHARLTDGHTRLGSGRRLLAAATTLTAAALLCGVAATSAASAADPTSAATLPAGNAWGAGRTRLRPAGPPGRYRTHRREHDRVVQPGLDLGVSTLELDVQITKDGFAVVTHDRDPVEKKCTDTGPAYPGDPMYPLTRTLARLRAAVESTGRHQCARCGM